MNIEDNHKYISIHSINPKFSRIVVSFLKYLIFVPYIVHLFQLLEAVFNWIFLKTTEIQVIEFPMIYLLE